jgi:hypothetical protein
MPAAVCGRVLCTAEGGQGAERVRVLVVGMKPPSPHFTISRLRQRVPSSFPLPTGTIQFC